MGRAGAATQTSFHDDATWQNEATQATPGLSNHQYQPLLTCRSCYKRIQSHVNNASVNTTLQTDYTSIKKKIIMHVTASLIPRWYCTRVQTQSTPIPRQRGPERGSPLPASSTLFPCPQAAFFQHRNSGFKKAKKGKVCLNA